MPHDLVAFLGGSSALKACNSVWRVGLGDLSSPGGSSGAKFRCYWPTAWPAAQINKICIENDKVHLAQAHNWLASHT